MSFHFQFESQRGYIEVNMQIEQRKIDFLIIFARSYAFIAPTHAQAIMLHKHTTTKQLSVFKMLPEKA